MAEVLNDVKYLHPLFRPKIVRIIAEMNRHSQSLGLQVHWKLSETLRSRARQQGLYLIGRGGNPGRIVTKINGVTSLSGHQYGLAVDFLPYTVEEGKHKPAYNHPDAAWSYLGHCARAEGLVWGGDWDSDQQTSDETFVDKPHIEWNRHDRAFYRKAWDWVKANYPRFI